MLFGKRHIQIVLAKALIILFIIHDLKVLAIKSSVYIYNFFIKVNFYKSITLFFIKYVIKEIHQFALCKFS